MSNTASTNGDSHADDTPNSSEMGTEEYFDALDLSDPEDESFEPDGPIQNQQLIQLVRTAAGSELFVNSVAQELMRVGQSNWGGMLGTAPDALGRLGQCFVLASDPLASSLVFPQSAKLPYKSLKANLVHCSDLGRKAFREAEARMKRMTLVAQAVCESDGTIDMIIEAVDDEDLAELDLPDQLAALKRISQDCIADTKAIKEKVDDWSQFANAVFQACTDQNETLGKNMTDLNTQIGEKKLLVEMKQQRVDDAKSQTAHYRRQQSSRQDELNKSRKSHDRGAIVDLGISAGEAIISTAKGLLNPFNFNLSWGKKDGGGGRSYYAPESHDAATQQDPGFILAEELCPMVLQLTGLLTNGPDELRGVDWDRLAGRREPDNTARHVLNVIAHTLQHFSREHSAVVKQVRTAVRPAQEVGDIILKMLHEEHKTNRNVLQEVADNAQIWRDRVNSVGRTLDDIMSAGLEQAKKQEEERAKRREQRETRMRTTKMTRAEIRYQVFRDAQQALFDAETRLNRRIDDELKATEEFNAMQLQLQQLLTSEATMFKVKEIVGECVRHLQTFCEKIDSLTVFFTDMQHYVDTIDRDRVDTFRQGAKVARELADRGKGAASEADTARMEKVKKRKFEQLRVKALELKGHYLVVQAMADTYVEVSAKYIMPGVNRIDRLSLPGATELSREERARKITEVGELATQARRDVKLLANARKDQFVVAMTERRGEIEELKELENGA